MKKSLRNCCANKIALLAIQIQCSVCTTTTTTTTTAKTPTMDDAMRRSRKLLKRGRKHNNNRKTTWSVCTISLRPYRFKWPKPYENCPAEAAHQNETCNKPCAMWKVKNGTVAPTQALSMKPLHNVCTLCTRLCTAPVRKSISITILVFSLRFTLPGEADWWNAVTPTFRFSFSHFIHTKWLIHKPTLRTHRTRLAATTRSNLRAAMMAFMKEPLFYAFSDARERNGVKFETLCDAFAFGRAVGCLWGPFGTSIQ